MFDALAFVQKQLAGTGAAPSRRYNKNTNGRTSRKQANARATLQRVGGTTNLVAAMYAPADAHLCRIVPMSTGWKSDGTPQRL